MTKILDDIIKIIHEEIDLSSDKITGINLLESIKFKIIPKLSIIENQIDKIEGLDSSNLFEFNESYKNLQINFNFNKDSTSHLKKEISTDKLIIVLKGRLILDFISDKKNSNSAKISIFPFMGICLSSQTIINLNSLKNTFFIELINFHSYSNIENLKKDII